MSIIYQKINKTKMHSTFFIILAFLLIGCSKNSDFSDSMAYVTNQKGGVLAISLDDFTILRELDVGSGARGIGITSDGKTIVVAVRESNDLAIIDSETFSIKERIYIGENPEFVRVKENLAFVSFEPAAIGGPPPKPGSKEESDLKRKRQEEDEKPARVAVVDLNLGKKITEIQGGMETEGIEFSFDEKKIIVTNEADENLSVHEISSGNLIKKIDTSTYGNRPRGIKRSPTGEFYLASIEYGDRLVKLDKNFDVIKDVETGPVPYGISFTGDGKLVYVALSKGKSLQVFDSESLKEVKKISTGNRCWHFSFTPNENEIIVACGRSNEILVIDTDSGKQIKKFSDQKMPWGVVTYPKSMGSLDLP
uniref:Uncharacterized conserved protein n=1 Tax=uncultured beta proteobacterium HF0130_04F21 TaxID=710819 RepID=E0XSU6_9PROT|nr:uncharacterized conserved protein [uncultured beta proteobacterium HF0130_04F21]